MIKVLPVTNCNDCPYLEKHEGIIRCDLSEAQSYEPEGEWMQPLEQFCPLYYLETIISDSYILGKEYTDFTENIIASVTRSKKTGKEDLKWKQPHEYMEWINDI